MNVAYVDSSVLVAVLFGERSAGRLRTALHRFDRLVASDLLVAEVGATATREGVDRASCRQALAAVSILIPDRSLEPEIDRVLETGYLRGADLWHVACALYVAGTEVERLPFLTLDVDQKQIARRLGFPAR